MKKRRTKSRGNGEGSIYQRKNGMWVAAFVVGGKRRSVAGQTAEAVREKMAAARRDGGVKQSNLSLRAFMERWLRESAPLTAEARTLANYADWNRLHVDSAPLADMPLRSITTEHVTAWLNGLRSKHVVRGKAKDGAAPADAPLVSASTVHTVWRMLRAALNVAKSWGLVASNAAAGVRMKKIPRTKVEPLSIEETRCFLGLVRGRRTEALWTLAVCTGMRQGELLGLRLVDVDTVDWRARVSVQLQRIRTAAPGSGPGKKSGVVESLAKAQSMRTVIIPQICRGPILAHLERRAVEQAAAADLWQESGRCFVTQKGTAIDARNLLREFYGLRDALGRDFRMHDLRHSAATMLHVAGVPETAIQEMLGHADPRTTREVYLHVVPASRREASDTMDKLLLGKKKKKVNAA